MSSAVFLQSRLDSSRLPYKALHDLDGKPLVSRCMEALSGLACDHHVLLCDHDSRYAFRSLAAREGWDLFAGPKQDVLERFLLAAREYRVDVICRGTGDNPLVSQRLSALLLDHLQQTGVDYALFRDTAIGVCVECVRTAALEQLWQLGPTAEEREHVCPGIYRRPETFRLSWPEAPDWAGRKPERYSIDTLEDYRFIQGLYEACPGPRPLLLEQVRAALPGDRALPGAPAS